MALLKRRKWHFRETFSVKKIINVLNSFLVIKLKVIGGCFLWKEKEEKVLILLKEKEISSLL